MKRSMTCAGPLFPSAPKPHRKALPAKAASAPSATARTTSSPDRMPLPSTTAPRCPPPPMVRHDDPVDPKRHAFLGIGRMQDPLDDEGPFPPLTIIGDLVPCEGAPHLPAHERHHLVYVGGAGGIRLEIAKARLTMSPQRRQVCGASQNATGHAQVGPE